LHFAAFGNTAKFALLARDRFCLNRYHLPMRRFLAFALGWIALCVFVHVPEAPAAPILNQNATTINPNIGVVIRPITPICQVLGNCTTTVPPAPPCGQITDSSFFTPCATTTIAPVTVDPCTYPVGQRPASCNSTTTTLAPTTTLGIATTTTGKPGTSAPPLPVTTIKTGGPLTYDTIATIPKTVVITAPPPVISDNVRIETTGASFGGVGVSAASGVKTISVSNLGTIPVRVSGATAAPPFSVVAGGGTCPSTPQLNPGATCTYQVVFRPTAPGQSVGAVSISILAPAGDLVAKAGVDGSGTAARIDFDAPNLDMGKGAIGEATVGTATLRNTGSSPITVQSLVLGGVKNPKKKSTEIVINAKPCIGATLAPGATCSVSVTFKPIAGVRKFDLIAMGTKGESAKSSVIRQGLRNSFSLSPGLVDFGPQQTAKASGVKKVTVRNTGEMPLKFQSPLLQGANLGDFTIAASTCSANPLAPKATCTIDLSTKPKAFGAKAATLRLASGKLAQVASLRALVPAPTTIPAPTTAAPITTVPTTPKPTLPAVVVFETIPPTVPPTEPPTTIAAVQPVLQMNPAVGPTGRVTLALGKGFPANTKLQLRWAGKFRGTWAVTTDGTGKFRLPILVNSGEKIGERTMTVVDQPGSFANIGSEFLAQLPTFRPGNGPRNDRLVSRR
jgi:hypothetical protein